MGRRSPVMDPGEGGAGRHDVHCPEIQKKRKMNAEVGQIDFMFVSPSYSFSGPTK